MLFVLLGFAYFYFKVVRRVLLVCDLFFSYISFVVVVAWCSFRGFGFRGMYYFGTLIDSFYS